MLFSFSQTSDYPVILSLENHCTLEQQKVMADHMITILGDALVRKPLGTTIPTNFPSPEVCSLVYVSSLIQITFTIFRALM